MGSISAKTNIEIRSRVSKLLQAKGGTFLRHTVYICIPVWFQCF